VSSSIIDLSKLRDIGWSMWDTIGLMPDGCTWRDGDVAGFEDEYDSYLQNATTQLRQGVPAAEVVRYLVKVETVFMGLSQRTDTMLRARAVVQAILAKA